MSADDSTKATPRPASGNGLAGHLRDAVTTRSALFIGGVLLIQLGFIASYLGAFHQPQPHDISLAVVAPEGAPPAAAEQTVTRIEQGAGDALQPRAVPSEQRARSLLDQREVHGALVLSGTGQPDRLLVTGASGATLVDALRGAVGAVERAQGRTFDTVDVKPAASGDASGLAGFYLAVGWTVGGYLVAALLGMTRGARPPNVPRALIRLGALVLYALASGIGGALLIHGITGAGAGHILPLWAFGTLLVLAVGSFTSALHGLAGTAGIGLAIILFVVLGNPSAGGAYPAPLLPGFWSTIGPWLPPGAGTDGFRAIAYFDYNGMLQPALVLTGYLVVGAVLFVLAAKLTHRDETRAA